MRRRTSTLPRWPAVAGLLAILVAGSAASQVAAARWSAAGEVRYLARDALASWEGVAPIEALHVTLDSDDVRTLRIDAVVRTEAFTSGNFLRDRTARRDVFEAGAHPEARLLAAPAPSTPRGALTAGASVVLVLDADLTLHGVTRSYRVDATLTREGPGPEVRAEATFTISLEEHAMRRPTLLGIVTHDAVTVTVRATGRPDPATTPTTR